MTQMPIYEHVLEKYRVLFEGLPEPVFYLHFYPMGDKSGDYGQDLWREFNYGRGLKRDKDKDGIKLREFHDEYERDLRSLLNAVMADSKGMHRGVVVIPSSTKGEINRVTEMTRKVLASNPRAFTDLTHAVIRVQDKEKAHAGGNRSYDKNYDTIDISCESGIENFDIILVLDDILTTGTSFRAMDDRLRDAGFTGAIVNFAFSHTFPSEGAACCWDAERSANNTAKHMKSNGSRQAETPVEGIIFDLDQTLLDDSTRDDQFERILGSSASSSNKMPYGTYQGVENLIGLQIPFAIVSNRSEWQLARMLRETSACKIIYPFYGDNVYE